VCDCLPAPPSLRQRGPIGNLNSQFFANVYLTGFDHFVKHTLKCRHYLRYCDDFVLLAPERETLIDWHERIGEYLREHLRLELNAKRTRVRPVSDGVDFVSYVAREDYLLLRRRVVSNVKLKLKEYQAELVREGRYWRRYRFDEDLLDKLFATLCSYLGHSLMGQHL
jgi:RNA-directed DNA polymerase